MKPQNITTIVKKELSTYFNNPTAYIVIIVFLLLWEFLFFRSALLIGEASLRVLFNFLPWLFIILIPALTMNSISGEKSEGTLELLLTHPVSAVELILGKFLASTIFVGLILLFVFPIAYSFDRFGDIDWGVVAGQYLASLLLTSVMVSLGIFISSLFTSPVAALLVSATASFFLIIAGFEIITLSLPTQLAIIAERLSALTHFESMARGVVDLRDLFYFGSAAAIFLNFAYLQLLKFRIGNQKQLYRRHILAAILLTAIAILINVLGSRIPGRLDLTQDQIYQLTDTTKNTLNQLDDVVNIQLFATQELPAQLRPILRDVKDTLRDYQTISNGQIKVAINDPGTDSQAKQQADSLGVQEVQFNVIGQEEFQLKKGYLGLAILYGGQSEILPFISDTSDLEYQITSAIVNLTTSDKKNIGFLSSHGEKLPFSQYQTLTGELEKLYQIKEFDLSQEEPQVPDEYDAIVIAGPSEPMLDAEKQALQTYIDSGGSAFVMIDNINVNETLLDVSINQSSAADLLDPYGVTVNYDLAYDLRSSETINFGGGGVNYILQYPFWPRALQQDTTSPITSKIKSIVLPWPSSISLDQALLDQQALQAIPLYTTTQFAGVQTGSFNIAPDQRLVPSDMSSQILAVSLLKQAPDTESSSRLVVVGDSDFLTEQFANVNRENTAFGMSAISWLVQDESLAKIQLKQRGLRPLTFTDPTQPQLIKYANLGLAFALPFFFGLARMLKRRSKRNLVYTLHL